VRAGNSQQAIARLTAFLATFPRSPRRHSAEALLAAQRGASKH
jgi:hypothetical protein